MIFTSKKWGHTVSNTKSQKINKIYDSSRPGKSLKHEKIIEIRPPEADQYTAGWCGDQSPSKIFLAPRNHVFTSGARLWMAPVLFSYSFWSTLRMCVPPQIDDTVDGDSKLSLNLSQSWRIYIHIFLLRQ